MKIIGKAFINIKIAFYKYLSDIKHKQGKYRAKQPVLLCGKGRVVFGWRVKFGYSYSPFRYSDIIYIEARSESGSIVFGDNVKVNNGCVFISDRTSITIGENVSIGTRVEIYDSDFHCLDPARRHHIPDSKPVKIGNNVFIGSNVVILKGVSIGNNSVIGNSSVVTKSFPDNAVVAGNPARLIRMLEVDNV